MSINQSTILKIVRRTAVIFLLAVSAISAFAVLGDKGKKPCLPANYLHYNE